MKFDGYDPGGYDCYLNAKKRFYIEKSRFQLVNSVDKNAIISPIWRVGGIACPIPPNTPKGTPTHRPFGVRCATRKSNGRCDNVFC